MMTTTTDLEPSLQTSPPHQWEDVWPPTYDLTCNRPTYTANLRTWNFPAPKPRHYHWVPRPINCLILDGMRKYVHQKTVFSHELTLLQGCSDLVVESLFQKWRMAELRRVYGPDARSSNVLTLMWRGKCETFILVYCQRFKITRSGKVCSEGQVGAKPDFSVHVKSSLWCGAERECQVKSSSVQNYEVHPKIDLVLL
ncbi:hypothetical protein AVEN_230787-1 [Araneus ventricosus]|uniref:Uncharacterized protein n=1 Tax=Araneus ventricosus TaxID=182803 RepID=A0A4Y2A270_ARAVE|nr:hypothetical protein AVEN_230787-1 [Araneus ventricosus]